MAFREVSVSPTDRGRSHALSHSVRSGARRRSSCARGRLQPGRRIATGPEPGPTPDVTATTALAFSGMNAGDEFSCGISTESRGYCWGWNNFAQLGDGTTTDRLTPVAVAGGLHFRQMNTGSAATCGVTTDYRAYCWGINEGGELGDGTTTDRFKPVAVVGGHKFIQIETLLDHTCAVSYPDGHAVLGYQQRGPARERHQRLFVPQHADSGVGRSHLQPDQDRGLPHLWIDHRQQDLLLGSQQRGPARRRHHCVPTPDAEAGDWRALLCGGGRRLQQRLRRHDGPSSLLLGIWEKWTTG
jgi:Regulator of chromosome condensation (RCC1) repeat